MTSIANSNNGSSQAQGNRQPGRQTRTNPSRISKTVARSYAYFGNSSNVDAPPTPAVPHGLYPALTHFTDSVAALPREFRRHNALLKEVDAKAWALEENLQHLLKIASDSEPVACPPNPAPIVDGVVREDFQTPAQNTSQHVEPQESKNRRLLFDRIRRTLSDLMMTADEKNHVITNANDELDHQLFRLDSIFPYISGEVSDEARLGSLTHWAYTNRGALKTATAAAHERPRRETAVNNHHLALNDPEVSSRSETRREAVTARKQRRAHLDSDFDEVRPVGRKGPGTKARTSAAGDNTGDGTAGQVKRRKVEKPQAAIGGTAMERSQSGVANTTGRGVLKDGTGTEPKKRARAPNVVSLAGRKRNNTVTSNAGSPPIASSPVVGTFNPIGNTASPGPSSAPRPQSSRFQHVTNQTANGRQRLPSATLVRVNNGKSTDTKASSKEGAVTDGTTSQPGVDIGREITLDNVSNDANKSTTATVIAKTEDREDRKAKDPDPLPSTTIITTTTTTTNAAKGRASKTSTPVVASFPETVHQRSRPSRSAAEAATTGAPKRSTHKKSGSVSVALQPPPAPASEDEESSREGDDEDDEGEPRYCYCNQVSFGEMVACDNDACPREWFHLSCVGLTKPPGKNVKWYCNECKENIKKGRSAGGR